MPWRSTKEGGKEEGEKKYDNGERRIRNEIAQKVVEGIKGKACAHENAKSTAQRTVGLGTARKSKTKESRKRMIGKRKTIKKCSGMRIRNWKRWKEALCRRMPWKK